MKKLRSVNQVTKGVRRDEFYRVKTGELVKAKLGSDQENQESTTLTLGS